MNNFFDFLKLKYTTGCTDVIYCVLIYYFLIYASLPSDDFFRPFGDEVYSHKTGDHYRRIGMSKVAYQDMPY